MNIRTIVFVGIAVLICGSLFFLIKPKKESSIPPDVLQATTTTQTNSKQSNVKVFELVVKNRKVVSGIDALKATEGDTVTIKITVDEGEEFHIHGYDKSVDLEKDVTTELTFVATLTGRFPFELEKSKTELGALEVLPKQ